MGEKPYLRYPTTFIVWQVVSRSGYKFPTLIQKMQRLSSLIKNYTIQWHLEN